MSEFTKGPWKHDRMFPNCVWANDLWIASTNVDGVREFEERVANARLIAAAPELLEALKGLASLAKDCIADAEDWHDYQHARRLIAKAEAA